MEHRRRLGLNLGLAIIAGTFSLAACGVETNPPDPAPAPPTHSPGPGPGPETPKPTCKPPTAGPTIHQGEDVEANEVWSADKSPHIVKGTINVRGGKTLTIEPCAEVRIAKGQFINVAFPITPNTGTLVAEGTAEQPIRIVGDEGARWASISVRAGGMARFAYVTFADGGAEATQNGATIAAYGDGNDGSDGLVFVDHVTIERSHGAGVWLSRGASFVKGSRDLVVEQSGNADDPFPLVIEEHAFDTLPTGRYTGNFKDEILVKPVGGRAAGSGLLEDATLHDRGVPYRIGEVSGENLRLGGRPDDKLVTLTIEPGVVMRFTPGTSLRVQHFTSGEPATAALRALGTADKPVIMTSAADAPKPGDWQGIWFGGVPRDTNQLDHVRIEYAGGDCGCSLNTCSNIAEHEGAVIFTAQPPAPFITNTVFANITGHGITQGFDGTFVDFRPTNQFQAVGGCEQTRPREKQCPSPRPACD